MSLKDEADDRTRTDNLLITNQLLCQLSHIGINKNICTNDSNGNRTRVTAVKGRCLNRLTMEPNKKIVPSKPNTEIIIHHLTTFSCSILCCILIHTPQDKPSTD